MSALQSTDIVPAEACDVVTQAQENFRMYLRRDTGDLPERKGRVVFTDARKLRFLLELARTGLVAHSAAVAGVSKTTVICHRKSDNQFADAWEEAHSIYCDNLEAEAYRRAVHGVIRAIYYQGIKVGEETHYSDRLMEMFLKRSIPEFQDRMNLDATVQAGVLVVTRPALKADEWAEQYATSAEVLEGSEGENG